MWVYKCKPCALLYIKIRNMRLLLIFASVLFTNCSNQSLVSSNSNTNLPFKLSATLSTNNQAQEILIYKIINQTSNLIFFDNRHGEISFERDTTFVNLGYPDYNLTTYYICNSIKPKETFLDTIFVDSDIQGNKPIDVRMYYYKFNQSELTECVNSGILDPELVFKYQPIEIIGQFEYPKTNIWVELEYRAK